MEKNNKKITYLVRHGAYDGSSENESLSFQGELEVFATSEKIKQEISGMKEGGLVKIFSSPVFRARQSAKIITESLEMYKPVLSVNYEIDLDEGGSRSARRLITNENYDVGILVTHQPNIEGLTGDKIKTGQYIKYKLD